MAPNHWDAFTDAELVFLLEAVEYGDAEISHGSRDLDLWESLLDAVEARSGINTEWMEIAQDRAAIERYRNPTRRKAPPPSPEPLSDGRRLPGVSVTYYQG